MKDSERLSHILVSSKNKILERLRNSRYHMLREENKNLRMLYEGQVMAYESSLILLGISNDFLDKIAMEERGKADEESKKGWRGGY